LTDALAVDLARQALWVVVLVAGPMIGLGLVIGLAVSVFQATTQINEQTLSFAPKLAAIAVALAVFGPWMLHTLTDFAHRLFASFPGWIGALPGGWLA
jgi:flagellar biosynthetic protein FliQ